MQNDQPDHPTRESIERFYEQWFEAMENADITGFLGLLDTGFFLKSPAQPAATDRQKLREGLEQFHQVYTETVDWTIEEIHIFDNHAIVRISEETILTNRENGEMKRLKGVHLGLLKRNSEGNWRLKTDVSSFDHPLPS